MYFVVGGPDFEVLRRRKASSPLEEADQERIPRPGEIPKGNLFSFGTDSDVLWVALIAPENYGQGAYYCAPGSVRRNAGH